MNNQYQLRFLDDCPVFEDKIGLHNNIAKSIKNIIALTHASKGNGHKKKIIGLFGSWGSGKSTVVEILKQELGDKKIFIFDSWSHRGDFLKRAFLLELANKLGVKEEEYKQEIGNGKLTLETVLTRKVINRIIDSKPLSKLDKPIKCLTSILILSVIIIALAKILGYLILPLVPNNLVDRWDKFAPKWIILVILTLLTLWKRKFISQVLSDFINFYFLRKANITESHTTKEDLEFTNYDYEKYLSDIIKIAKEKNKFDTNSPFIIVFDNIDRVEDETVLNTLSLIQLTNEAISKFKFNNIYFLIPIDKERLEKTVKTIIAKSDSDDGEREKFARDFLEKIFPYKIIIPNISHTNWRKFFAELIKEAFSSSNISENDILFIRRLFEQAIIESNTNLTPREIKNFINSFVENYIYWQNFEKAPDLKLQALFVILNNYLSEELKGFIDKFEESKSFEKVIQSVNGNNSDGSSKSSSFKKIKKIIDIANNEFTEKEILASLLKQFYRTDKIYTLFVEQFNNAINTKDVDTINKIVKLLGDKDKIIALIDAVIESKTDYAQDINLLLKLIYSFRKSKLKVYDTYDMYKKLVDTSLKDIIADTEELSKLDISNVNEFKYIIDSNTKIRNMFIEKSAEIITLTSKEE